MLDGHQVAHYPLARNDNSPEINRTMPDPSFAKPEIRAAFDNFEPEVRQKLLVLRALIFAAGEVLGNVTESLKWGQPSYDVGKDGTPIRLGPGKAPNSYGFFVHCQTDLIAQFEALYGDQLNYAGSRSVWFETSAELPRDIVIHCLKLALTYHARKREKND